MHYIKLIIVAIMLIAAIINAIIEIRLARLASLLDNFIDNYCAPRIIIIF